MKVLDFMESKVAKQMLFFMWTFLKGLPRLKKKMLIVNDWVYNLSLENFACICSFTIFILYFLIYQCLHRVLPTDYSRSSKLMVSQRDPLSHNSKDSGSPKHKTRFLFPSIEECIRQNEKQFYRVNIKLLSFWCILNIYTHRMLRGYENSSEGPVNLISTTSDKAFTGSHIRLQNQIRRRPADMHSNGSGWLVFILWSCSALLWECWEVHEGTVLRTWNQRK